MKNKKGGNKAKKQKKIVQAERKLELKDEDEPQEYAQIKRVFGNSRFEAECFDGIVRLAHSRGVLKRQKVFVKIGDVVVVSLRDFQDGKCDILYVYTQNEVKLLKKVGAIPNTVIENETVSGVEEVDIGFDIEDESKNEEGELNFEDI